MRKSAGLIALVLALTMLVSGCSSSTSSESGSGTGSEGASSSDSVVRNPISIHWAAGSSSGSCYITGTVMGGLLSELYDGYFVVPEVTTGGIESCKMLLNGDAQFISIQSDDAMSVNNNTRGWVDVPEATDALRYVGAVNKTQMNIFVPKSSGITTFEELKGKKIGVLSGTTYSYGWPVLLEAYGMTEADFDSVEAMSRPDLCTALQDGAIDGIFDITPDNQSAHQEVAFAVGGYTVISIPDDVRAKIQEINPAYQLSTIEADMYNGNEEANTCCVYNIWCCKEDLDYQVVYDILTLLFDHDADFKAAHPLAGVASPEVCIENQVVPWHPAAEQFFKDRGWL